MPLKQLTFDARILLREAIAMRLLIATAPWPLLATLGRPPPSPRSADAGATDIAVRQHREASAMPDDRELMARIKEREQSAPRTALPALGRPWVRVLLRVGRLARLFWTDCLRREELHGASFGFARELPTGEPGSAEVAEGGEEVAVVRQALERPPGEQRMCCSFVTSGKDV